MKKPLLKIATASLVVAVLAAMPTKLSAQSTNAAAAEKKSAHDTGEAPKKKASGAPFHGKLVAVDKAAKTLSVGKRTFQITSQTRMNKAGKPAVLDDAVVGEEVSGYIKPSEDGKLIATTVNFGPKAEGKTSEKKQPAPAKEN